MSTDRTIVHNVLVSSEDKDDLLNGLQKTFRGYLKPSHVDQSDLK